MGLTFSRQAFFLPYFSANGSVTTTSSAALIAETLQQIDRLGLELDSYCTGLDNGADDGEKKCNERQENKIQQRKPPPIPPKRNDVNFLFKNYINNF